MAHSQKSIRDHARNRTHPNVDNQAISQQLEDLVKPCVYNQLAYYRGWEMRALHFKFAINAGSSVDACLATSTEC